MKVLIVSQCSKKAISETQRVIDQFAERKGSAVWETLITEQGLTTLKKLLKATARKNTAVACHLLRGNLQTELLWIVGNPRKFNRQGLVPTNITSKDLLRSDDENEWNSGEAIAIFAAIAGLFHDFGKANDLFQKKLRSTTAKSYEPFRHEWVSLLLFKEFVGNLSDREWLEKLSQINPKDDISFRDCLKDYKYEKLKINPLKDLPPIAKLIAWLILSHHRLPVYCETTSASEPDLSIINNWMDNKCFSSRWNSFNCDDEAWVEKDKIAVVNFSNGTPISSSTWCRAAKRAALHALKFYQSIEKSWFEDRFSMHLSRAVLMLADHLYSSEPSDTFTQDGKYSAYANSEKKPVLKLKQKLDEHNINVAKNAFLIAKILPKFQESLPFLINTKGFKKRSSNPKFSWQDKALDLSTSLKKDSFEGGFFGINLASTGCGKTLANAKIMFGLSDERKGCRFNIALGLRVLTLQTGEALRQRLNLTEEDLAVVIGSEAVQELYEMNLEDAALGSESNEDPVAETDEVFYDDYESESKIDRWLKKSDKLRKIVKAPVLVSTIDHLISATESGRGGHQIAPLLRLLSSDLVLDEPDDFDVKDLPALCRLVNFAGVFGSRVLLSSATLPPAIVKALFESYVEGRKLYNAARKKGRPSKVVCAWFDEFSSKSDFHESPDEFMSTHEKFIDKRLCLLQKQSVLRKASLLKIDNCGNKVEEIYKGVAGTIKNSIYELHQYHHQTHLDSGKKVSIGLVRMANIDPMIGVVKELISSEVRDNFCIHFCVYHSQFNMLVRSKIEQVLDKVLTRHNQEKLWDLPEIMTPLNSHSATNHIFVVFGTAVTEVGRDHDYDWAIIEPSSMRSIIQLAGRVQRHRQTSPKEDNIKILQFNIKGLKGLDIAFEMPGFESKKCCLLSKDIAKVLRPEEIKVINAAPRLVQGRILDAQNYLVDLEHERMNLDLFGKSEEGFYASLWWRTSAHWTHEIPRRSRFRKPLGKQLDYVELLNEADESPKLHVRAKDRSLVLVDKIDFCREEFMPNTGHYNWVNVDLTEEIKLLAKRNESSREYTSQKFACITLRELKETKQWTRDPLFGFYQKN